MLAFSELAVHPAGRSVGAALLRRATLLHLRGHAGALNRRRVRRGRRRWGRAARVATTRGLLRVIGRYGAAFVVGRGHAAFGLLKEQNVNALPLGGKFRLNREKDYPRQLVRNAGAKIAPDLQDTW